MRVGVDLDGVCYDFVDSVRRHLDRPELPDADCWDFFKHQWGMTTADFLACCAEGVDAGVIFRTGEPLPETAWALHALKGMGHTIHIVTNRNFGKRSVQNTADWLADHDLPYHTLTFAADKTTVPVDVFIEDNVENYQALDADGVAAFLMDRPWNRHLDTARRVWSLTDFVYAVERLADRRPETILEEAQRLVHGNRGEDYGHPADDFTRTGRIWGAILGIPDVSPEHVGLCMAGVKISREVNAHKRDNLADLAGYAETVDMVHERAATA